MLLLYNCKLDKSYFGQSLVYFIKFMMSCLLRSFYSIDRWTVTEVDSRSTKLNHLDHEKIEDPETWNPPILTSEELYKVPSVFNISKKILLKQVELRIKISSPSIQIVGLNLFSEDEIKKFRDYVKEKKFSYLHFGGIRIVLAPLFCHGLNTPCLFKIFDTRHNNYDHDQIGTIMGNLSSGCQYGTIYPDCAINLSNVHLKDCSKILVGVQGLQMVDDSEYLSILIQTSFQLTNIVHPKLKQLVLRDCVTVGISNAQVKGVTYEKEALPNDWYIQYKSLENLDSLKGK